MTGCETFGLEGADEGLTPRKALTLRIHRADGSETRTQVLCRLDTDEEIRFFRNGGLLPQMLSEYLA